MAATPMTLIDLECHFCCLKPFNFHASGKVAYIIYDMFIGKPFQM